MLQMACIKPSTPPKVFQMGEKVQSGPLIYNVFETKWLTQAGSPDQPRLPANRFLVVRFSAVNGGSEEVTLPSLALLTAGGESYNELMDVSGIPGWVGLLRSVKPAETLEGAIVFDVPPGSYRLRVGDGSDSATQALVDLPLRFDGPVPGAQ